MEKIQASSGLDDLLELNFASVSLNRIYQISDRLYSKKFEGSASLNPSAKNGRSKEKRSDCPLITLGLVLDEQGFCKRSRLFEGNISEGITLKEMVEGLEARDELIRPIVVLDAGMTTESNLQWLRKEENHFDYMVVSPKSKSVFPDDQTPVILKNKNKKQYPRQFYFLELLPKNLIFRINKQPAPEGPVLG